MSRSFEPRMRQEVGMNVSRRVGKAKDRNEFGAVNTRPLANRALSFGKLASRHILQQRALLPTYYVAPYREAQDWPMGWANEHGKKYRITGISSIGGF